MLSPAPPNLNWTSAIDAAKIQKKLIDNQKVEKNFGSEEFKWRRFIHYVPFHYTSVEMTEVQICVNTRNPCSVKKKE